MVHVMVIIFMKDATIGMNVMILSILYKKSEFTVKLLLICTVLYKSYLNPTNHNMKKPIHIMVLNNFLVKLFRKEFYFC